MAIDEPDRKTYFVVMDASTREILLGGGGVKHLRLGELSNAVKRAKWWREVYELDEIPALTA